MPSNGDRLDRAIEFSVAKIQAAGYSTGRLLVMTPDVGQHLDLAIEQAKKAASSGFVVDVIGVSDRPNEKLQLVAEAGKGQYHSIKADEQWLENLASAISRHEGALMTEKNKRTVWLDAGWYFLGIPLLFCLLFFRKGLLVIMLLMSVEAQAGFFENSNQEALQAFNREDYDVAAQRFSDRNWQAATAYRQGNYQLAYELYQQDNSSEGLYNQGNALAKGGKIDEAIAKYEEVLRSNPAHEDAKFNLEYLKQQQQQQSSAQSQNQNENNDNEQQSQQNKEDSSDKQNEGQQKQDTQQDSSAGEENSENQQSAEGNDSTAPQDANDNHNDDRADKDRQRPSEAELDETNEASEGKSEQGVVPQTDEENQEEYNEQIQAKAQQYRDIPEDAGGLLKAFIYQEYQKNRYNK
jgi:Ca-activated chloride channel family protein